MARRRRGYRRVARGLLPGAATAAPAAIGFTFVQLGMLVVGGRAEDKSGRMDILIGWSCQTSRSWQYKVGAALFRCLNATRFVSCQAWSAYRDLCTRLA